MDLENGRVVRVPYSLLSVIKEGDDGESLGKWESEEVEIAKALVADSGERFVEAPGRFDFHEYRQMERFIGTVKDDAVAGQLWQAIKGKGAFRYFKDTASRRGLLQQWYQYRDSAMKEFVRNWVEAHRIAIVDDTSANPQQ